MPSDLRLGVHAAVSVCAILLWAGTAAADGYVVPKAVVVAPVPTWTGCYGGLDSGYKWGRNHIKNPATYNLNNPVGIRGTAIDTPRQPVTNLTTTGGGSETGHTDGELVGIQAGCNYQLKPGILIGIEVSGTRDWATDTITEQVVNAATRASVTNVTTEIERRCQFRVGPRIGATLPGLTGQKETLALAPLFYATGGYAATCYQVKQSGGNPTFRGAVTNPDVSDSDFESGWFVGGGVDIPTEFFIANTFVQIEYSHAEYGDMTIGLAGSDDTRKLDNRSDEVRVGFKYRFGLDTSVPK